MTDPRRGPRHRGGGGSPTWRRIRARILARDPVCQICGQRPATAVDHIVAIKAGGSHRDHNLRGVCIPCNSRKAAQEEGGFGRAPKPAFGVDAAGLPLSPTHWWRT